MYISTELTTIESWNSHSPRVSPQLPSIFHCFSEYRWASGLNKYLLFRVFVLSSEICAGDVLETTCFISFSSFVSLLLLLQHYTIREEASRRRRISRSICLLNWDRDPRRKKIELQRRRRRARDSRSFQKRLPRIPYFKTFSFPSQDWGVSRYVDLKASETASPILLRHGTFNMMMI